MMDDPFERAVEREDVIRADEALVRSGGRWATRWAILLAVALPVHVVVADRWTGWLSLHAAALMVVAVQSALYRRDVRGGVRAPVIRRRFGGMNINTVAYGRKKEARW
jgi:hypothetical protein